MGTRARMGLGPRLSCFDAKPSGKIGPGIMDALGPRKIFFGKYLGWALASPLPPPTRAGPWAWAQAWTGSRRGPAGQGPGRDEPRPGPFASTSARPRPGRAREVVQPGKDQTPGSGPGLGPGSTAPTSTRFRPGRAWERVRRASGRDGARQGPSRPRGFGVRSALLCPWP